MLTDNMLSGGHARALLPLEDPKLQYDTACKVYDKKLSVRDTEKLVRQLLRSKSVIETPLTDENSFIYHDLEEKLKNIIGTKVSINWKQKDRGKIEIEYYSDEDLERIMDLFNTLV
jgi:ParB family chromosome partitioning protein